MSALAGPLHLVALVLVVSGAQKVGAPRPAAQAMRDAGLPVPVRAQWPGAALGVVEAAIGLAVFAAPHRLSAAAVAAAYLGFAGFVVVLRRRDATAGCGCFGAASTPPTTTHVVVNLLSAGIALASTVAGVADVADVLDEGVGVAVPYAALVAVGAALLLLAPVLLGQLDQLVHGDQTPQFGLRRSTPRPTGAQR